LSLSERQELTSHQSKELTLPQLQIFKNHICSVVVVDVEVVGFGEVN
jgi:hypothetical protein